MTHARTFIEKRAALQQGRCKVAVNPLGMAAQVVASKPRLWNKLVSKEGLLLGGPLLGLGVLSAPALSEAGERIRRSDLLFGDPLQRANMPENTAKEYAKSLGKNLGQETVNLLGSMLSSTLGLPAALSQQNLRQSIFETLRTEDDVIAQAEPQQLEEAYHTMARFAPTLATDKNAVKTFLRESVLYGAGPNFMSIKQLADAEKAVLAPQLPTQR